MARQLQNRVLDLVDAVTGQPVERETCPEWLRRPGPADCRDRWPTVQAIYTTLTGSVLPDELPTRERRSLDAVMATNGRLRIVEVDEVQHFSPPRATTIELYPDDINLAFDKEVWHVRAAAATKLRGGGWGRPCPPLFPDPGGRHLQRAFRDALADLLPGAHGWDPTLRIGDFEVIDWLDGDNALDRMRSLLEVKGVRV